MLVLSEHLKTRLHILRVKDTSIDWVVKKTPLRKSRGCQY